MLRHLSLAFREIYMILRLVLAAAFGYIVGRVHEESITKTRMDNRKKEMQQAVDSSIQQIVINQELIDRWIAHTLGMSFEDYRTWVANKNQKSKPKLVKVDNGQQIHPTRQSV